MRRPSAKAGMNVSPAWFERKRNLLEPCRLWNRMGMLALEWKHHDQGICVLIDTDILGSLASSLLSNLSTRSYRLHVNGSIKCDGDRFVAKSVENLEIIRGGFSCRSADPESGPGYKVILRF